MSRDFYGLSSGPASFARILATDGLPRPFCLRRSHQCVSINHGVSVLLSQIENAALEFFVVNGLRDTLRCVFVLDDCDVICIPVRFIEDFSHAYRRLAHFSNVLCARMYAPQRRAHVGEISRASIRRSRVSSFDY